MIFFNRELYGLGTKVHTLLRGTLRFKGFSDCIKSMQLLGLIDTEAHPMLHPNGPDVTWVRMLSAIANIIIDIISSKCY